MIGLSLTGPTLGVLALGFFSIVPVEAWAHGVELVLPRAPCAWRENKQEAKDPVRAGEIAISDMAEDDELHSAGHDGAALRFCHRDPMDRQFPFVPSLAGNPLPVVQGFVALPPNYGSLGRLHDVVDRDCLNERGASSDVLDGRSDWNGDVVVRLAGPSVAHRSIAHQDEIIKARPAQPPAQPHSIYASVGGIASGDGRPPSEIEGNEEGHSASHPEPRLNAAERDGFFRGFRHAPLLAQIGLVMATGLAAFGLTPVGIGLLLDRKRRAACGALAVGLSSLGVLLTIIWLA